MNNGDGGGRLSTIKTLVELRKANLDKKGRWIDVSLPTTNNASTCGTISLSIPGFFPLAFFSLDPDSRLKKACVRV